MAFDGITIANITKELNDKLIGGRIRKIAQPENDELILTIKSAEGNFRLLISASASLVSSVTMITASAGASTGWVVRNVRHPPR